MTYKILPKHLAFPYTQMKYVVEPGEFTNMFVMSSNGVDLKKVILRVER
jgi:hypothetical protein